MYTKQRVKQIITSSYETISAIKKDNPPFSYCNSKEILDNLLSFHFDTVTRDVKIRRFFLFTYCYLLLVTQKTFQ